MVDQTIAWGGGYSALSSFGFGGSNVHLLLQGQPSPQAKPAARVINVTAEDASLAQEGQETVDAPLAQPVDDAIPLASRTPQGIEALREAIKVSDTVLFEQAFQPRHAVKPNKQACQAW